MQGNAGGRVVRYIDVCHSLQHSLNIVECDLLSTSKPPGSAKFLTLFEEFIRYEDFRIRRVH